jgi:hypothetical protein
MLGHELRLRARYFWELALQGCDNPGVDLLAPGAEQCAVRGILHQRVFEGVLCIGRRSTPEDQLGACQLRKGVIDLWLRHLCDCADQLVGERTAERRSYLRYLTRRREAIKAGQQ